MKFLCAAGSDVAGSFMWGASSFAAHMASRQTAPIADADIPRAYLDLANATGQTGAGSSAGGEQPKFTCEAEGMIGPGSVRQVLVLTAFSELIGNVDRHFENLSLMTDERARPVGVSPAYDMLPTIYAPGGGGIEPPLRPVAPSFRSLGARPDVWAQAFEAAHAFWLAAAGDERLSRPMRRISAGNAGLIAEVVAPLLPARAAEN